MAQQRIHSCVGELNIEIEGQGPPAILWHSLMVDSHQWDRVRAELRSHRTLIVIDGPGHSASGPPPAEFTLIDAADGAAEVLSHLDIDMVDWVGSAWGGHVGTVFATRHPDRVRTLITIGAPLTPLSGAERRKIVMMVRALACLDP